MVAGVVVLGSSRSGCRRNIVAVVNSCSMFLGTCSWNPCLATCAWELW